MKTLKNIFYEMKVNIAGRRGLSFPFIAASVVFSVGTLIAYCVTGVTSYTPELSAAVIALQCVNVALGVLFSVCEIKVGKYAVYLTGLWAWLEYLISQASYLSSILVAIDNVSLSPGFIITVISGLLAWISALVAAIVQKREIGSSDRASGAIKAEE